GLDVEPRVADDRDGDLGEPVARVLVGERRRGREGDTGGHLRHGQRRRRHVRANGPQSAAVTDHVAGQARWVIGQDQQVELLRAGAGDQVDLLYLVAADAGDLYQLPLKE